MAPGFSDHFSSRAQEYATGRPRYPAALGDFLRACSPSAGCAWEAGCGSGQFTTLLAERFTRVIAVDASAAQLAAAPRSPTVEYRVARAEDGLAENSIADLIVAAQAAHWFDLVRFYAACRRAAKPGAVLALVAYRTVELDDARLHATLRSFYDDDLAGHWPSERRAVELGYRSLDFPFAPLTAPEFTMPVCWDVARFLAYVDSWSAVRSLERSGQRARYDEFAARVRTIAPPTIAGRFPLALRIGRIEPPLTE